jgi:hypothetical protein
MGLEPSLDKLVAARSCGHVCNPFLRRTAIDGPRQPADPGQLGLEPCTLFHKTVWASLAPSLTLDPLSESTKTLVGTSAKNDGFCRKHPTIFIESCLQHELICLGFSK